VIPTYVHPGTGEKIDDDDDGGLLLQYTGGDKCDLNNANAQLKLNMICDDDRDDSDELHYNY